MNTTGSLDWVILRELRTVSGCPSFLIDSKLSCVVDLKHEAAI